MQLLHEVEKHLSPDQELASNLAADLHELYTQQSSVDAKGTNTGAMITPKFVSEQVHAWIQHAIQIKEAEVEQVADEHKDLLVQPEQDVARPAAEAPAPKRVIHDLTSLPSPHVTDDEEDLEQANREALNEIYGDSSSSRQASATP